MSRTIVQALKLAGLLIVLFSPHGRAAVFVLVIERPALALVAVLSLWVFARLLGVAASLGYEALRELDVLIAGGLTATIGCYALLCRGVGVSGLVATAILSGAYMVAVLRRYGRPGTCSLSITTCAWVAVLYRFFLPV